MQNHWLFSSNTISVSAKKFTRKKSKEDEQTLEELNLADCRSQSKFQLLQTSYIKQIKLFLFLPYNRHLINRAKSVCMEESWPQSCVQTSLRSVCTYDLGQDSPIQTSCSVNKSWVSLQSAEIWFHNTAPVLEKEHLNFWKVWSLCTCSTGVHSSVPHSSVVGGIRSAVSVH